MDPVNKGKAAAPKRNPLTRKDQKHHYARTSKQIFNPISNQLPNQPSLIRMANPENYVAMPPSALAPSSSNLHVLLPTSSTLLRQTSSDAQRQINRRTAPSGRWVLRELNKGPNGKAISRKLNGIQRRNNTSKGGKRKHRRLTKRKNK